MVRLFVLAAAWVLISAPSVAETGDTEDLRESFEAAVAALNAGQIDGFLENVHERALSFYACGPTSGKEGKEACQLDWERFFGKTAEAQFQPENMQYRVIGNTGIAWGDYAVSVRTRDGKQFSHHGRYTMTYTKQGGEWKVVMQHNTPAELGPAGPRERMSRASESGR